MKIFLFRSMIGIFFGAFIFVMVTNSIVYFGEKEALDGQLFLKKLAWYHLLWLVFHS